MFLGAAQNVNILARVRQEHGDEEFFDNEDMFPVPVLLSFDWNAIAEVNGFMSPWWPTRGYLLGGWGFEGDNLVELSAKHSDMWRSFGSNGRLGFVGITRDAYGSPLGGCTVRCFRNSTNELVSAVTSDANGFYIATTPYNDAHYLVVHKTGSPNVAGASVNTITPS